MHSGRGRSSLQRHALNLTLTCRHELTAHTETCKARIVAGNCLLRVSSLPVHASASDAYAARVSHQGCNMQEPRKWNSHDNHGANPSLLRYAYRAAAVFQGFSVVTINSGVDISYGRVTKALEIIPSLARPAKISQIDAYTRVRSGFAACTETGHAVSRQTL